MPLNNFQTWCWLQWLIYGYRGNVWPNGSNCVNSHYFYSEKNVFLYLCHKITKPPNSWNDECHRTLDFIHIIRETSKLPLPLQKEHIIGKDSTQSHPLSECIKLSKSLAFVHIQYLCWLTDTDTQRDNLLPTFSASKSQPAAERMTEEDINK